MHRYPLARPPRALRARATVARPLAPLLSLTCLLPAEQMAPTDITDFAWFPAAAKDADHFKLFRIDKLAWRLRAHPKDLEFVDDSGAELPFEKLGDYILFIYQKYTAQRQPKKFKYFSNGKYVTFDPSFRVVGRPAASILMLFEENRKSGKQPWVFQRWCVEERPPILAIKGQEKQSVPATIPDDFICPITLDLMVDPVVAADGHTYDRCAIEEWFVGHSTSPKTGAELTATELYPNYTVRGQIRTWQEAQRCRPDGPAARP